MATVDIRGATVSAADPPISTNPSPDLAWKAPCRAATTGANITLSGTQTIDGIALASGDRVLVKDQTSSADNGIYNAQSSVWTRAIDGNNNSQWTTGTQVVVTSGTANSGRTYELTTAIPVILGTSAMTFALVSAASGNIIVIRQPAAAATIAILSSDIEVGIDTTSSAVSATLPAAAAWLSANPNGLELTLVDIKGNAAAHNITPTLNGADTFSYGGVTPAITANFGLLKLRPVGSPATGWYVRGLN